MDNDHESHVNGAGKHTSKSLARIATPPPPPGRYEQVFNLTNDIAALELQMNEKMSDLNRLLRSIDDRTLPSLLVDLLKRPAPQHSSMLTTLPVNSSTPTIEGFGTIELPVSTRSSTPVSTYTPGTFEARIVELMSDGRERRAAVIIKTLKAKARKSSVYHALKVLVADGILVKPAYAHYRKP